ncbi:hypothetical protein Landi51_10057 [Colletotrichum acutatum]
MLSKVALTRVTTRVASNTPIRMAPFDNLGHHGIQLEHTEYILDSLITLDVPSESSANDTTAMPVPLDWRLNGGLATRALCSARFRVPTSGGCWSSIGGPWNDTIQSGYSITGPKPAYLRYRSLEALVPLASRATVGAS